MSLQIQSWENMLLAKAQEALTTHQNRTHTPAAADRGDLAAAYETCNQITQHHSKTFYMASALLPHDKREAARALYAFCRITDDIVDSPEHLDVKEKRLQQWRATIMSPNMPTNDPVALAWFDTQARYNIPRGYAEQLIDGVARDLTQTRYETFDDLANYSYGVASTVGLMAMHIIGFESYDAIPYAVRLGVALQLTNILRDVGEDWRAGRLYLPQEELRRFNICEDDINQCCLDDRWNDFMTFQINRARKLYDESWEGISMLNPNGRLAIAAAADLYRAILDDIEQNSCDVFSRRARVNNMGKLARLPRIWIRSRRKYH